GGSGETLMLEPMDSAMRKQVHEWAEAHGLTSTSVGTEPHRYVVVESRRDVDQWLINTAESLKAERLEEAKQLEKQDGLRTGTSVLVRVVDVDASGPGGRTRILLEGPLKAHKLSVRSEVRIGTLTGVVAKVFPTRLEIISEALVSDVVKGRVRVDARPNDATYALLDTALRDLKQARSELRRVLLDERPCPVILEEVASSLNKAQTAALTKMGSLVSLVHGPPGTGKTTTIAELIARAARSGQRILACAPSHIAVDTLLEGVAAKLKKMKGKKVDLVRLGHPARLSEGLASACSLETRLKNADGADVIRDARKELFGLRRREAQAVRAEIRKRENVMESQVLNGTSVVFATLAGAARVRSSFDLVVVDEAAQALEIACWIPILKGTRVVLAGDHKQLPPTVKSNDSLLEATLFERLSKRQNVPSTLLTTQYRMNKVISDWASNEMYDGSLVADASCAESTLENFAPMTVVDTAGSFLEEDEHNDSSISNTKEAQVVADHVTGLLDVLPPSQICVIAPYNAQVAALRDVVPDGVDCKTVDGFQGGERDAVVLSLTRSNGHRSVGFLADERRLNVAVTRAKRHVCIVCDSDTVSASPFIARLLDYVADHGDYRLLHQAPVVAVAEKPVQEPPSQSPVEEPPPADVDDGPHAEPDEPHAEPDEPHAEPDEPHAEPNDDEPHAEPADDGPHLELVDDEPHSEHDEPQAVFRVSFEGTTYDVPSVPSVPSLRRAIEAVLRVPVARQRLVAAGRTLADDTPLEANSKILLLAAPQKEARKRERRRQQRTAPVVEEKDERDDPEPATYDNSFLASLAAERRARTPAAKPAKPTKPSTPKSQKLPDIDDEEALLDAAIESAKAERKTAKRQEPAWKRWIDEDGTIHQSDGRARADKERIDRLAEDLHAKLVAGGAQRGKKAKKKKK
ncbi:MAG: AAA domain-containing protein, partial [Planctomycetota bacterium]